VAMQGQDRRPTMKDVAKRAGVSQSSVSLVLNNMTGARIAEATRRRILDAAREVGYSLTPRLSPSRPERNIVLYIVDEISTSPHPAVTIDGARDAAWQNGFVLHVCPTRSDREIEQAVLETMPADHVAGIVYSAIFSRMVTVPPVLHTMPSVLLNCYAEDRSLASVVPGEVAGGHTATAHLIEAGHRRIGFINGEAWMDASRDRLKGYRQALATADLPYDPALVRPGDWLPDTGYSQTHVLMELDEPPTAIFCANDLMAVGCLEALRERGLSVPVDISVIGYDDQEIAQYTRPGLSTVLLPNAEMGRWAVEHLVGQLAQGTRRPLQVKMECPLVPRHSVAPPRRARAVA